MMKKYLQILFFLFFLSTNIFAQKEGNIWYFGQYAGLDFNSGNPVALTNSAMNNTYGCATISDPSGNLLFYTNGRKVWNKSHTLMTNGTGLYSDSLNTQSATIIPLPGSTRYYYIFSVFGYSWPYGLCYSIVDMTLDAGRGAITNKNIPIIAPVTDKISAVRHSNNKSIWIIVHGWNSDAFYSFLLNSSGLNSTPTISHSGPTFSGPTSNYYGYMKCSPDSKTIAFTCVHGGYTGLFDFDNNTGKVSNPRQLLYNNNAINGYGLEFSPDGSKLYISGQWVMTGKFFQFDLSLKNINQINDSIKVLAVSFPYMIALQISPNGKIYGVTNSLYIDVINSPNNIGNLCNYTHNSLYLGGKKSGMGLPTFIQSYFFVPSFDAKPLCLGDTTKFSITNTTNIDSVLWDFGNPLSGSINYSKLLNSAHKYNDTGTYRVNLILYHFGVADTTYRIIKITYYPITQFTVIDSSQCLNVNNFQFNNHSLIPYGSLNYIWDFGDTILAFDTISTRHTYKYDKTYTVKLTTLSDYGCEKSYSKQVIVKPSPIVSFTINDTTQCLKANKLIFINQSTIVKNTALTYKWSFGNGDSSMLKNPVYSYISANSYNIQLITSSNLGCKDTFSRTALIYPPSNPIFSVNDSAQCLTGNSFSFNNLTSSPPAISNWLWKFGDGKTDTSYTVSHTYKTANTFTVNLITTTTNGCKDTSVKNVFVYPMPDTALTVNNTSQCLDGNSFLFTAPNGSSSYQWDYGDGFTDTGRMVSHSYSSFGNFTVKTFLASHDGCADTAINTVTVIPSPVAAFTVDDSIQCFKGNSFTFSNPNQPSITSRQWWFGDGKTDTGLNTVHTYSSAGNYLVKFLITHSSGCMDSLVKIMTIHPTPDGIFGVNDSDQCLKENSITFSNSIQNDITGRQWWFGDGATDTGISVFHSYLSSGNFKVHFIITNKFNCLDSSTKNITIRPSPDAGFTVNDSTQCLSQNSFSFNCPQPATNYLWNMGDGNSYTGSLVLHKYSATGNFQVKLLVSNSFGCQDSLFKNIDIFPSPDASFTINNPIQCLNGNSFTFTKNDQLSVFNDAWNFGDAQAGSGKSAIHSYVSDNIFNVRLIVTTGDHCSDTTSQTITVKPNPIAPTASNNSPLCEDETLNLYANTTETVSFDWSADNGFTSSLQNPVISNVRLRDSGVYYVKAIMNGCESNNDFTRVIINTRPFFSFDQNQTICPGDMFILDPGFFDSYVWQDNSVNRTFNITEPGLYKVVVYNTHGCNYSDSVLITKKCPTILFIPASFTPNNDNINDRFEIITDNVREYDLKIYNRWGELIFHSTDPVNYWDGTYNNANCMDGVYYYQFNMRDMDGKTREVRGTITVLR